jgi:enoyl-CoA hydratase/carnithine racemase
MPPDLVSRRDDSQIARLTLNDPDRANVLSFAMIEALDARLAEAAGDPAIRVIVLDAAGKVFCGGHDLGEMRATEDPADHEGLFTRCAALMQAIGAAPKPVIAKVRRSAVAAGCQLVASCDLAFAAEGARFAVSGINLGLFCSTPAVALSRVIGEKAALEMLLTGRFVGAAEAASLGLINRAVADADLNRVVDETAAAIAGKCPDAVALGKTLFRQQLELGVTDAYALACRGMAVNMTFSGAKAGIDSFLSR